MKKFNNTILLAGILAVLVLVYVGISYFGGSSRSKSFREELVNFDKDQVTRIEIASGGNTTILSGGPDDWKVQLRDGSSKPARAANVNSLMSTLNTIEPSRIASRSKEQWSDFQVDSAGTQVTVYEGSEEVLDIVLGRFGMEGQRSFYTYVRLAEESDTYVANNFMSMSVSKDPEGYRNNEIIRLKKDSLETITFDYPDSAFTLVKSTDSWFVDELPADSANVASYLSGLGLVTSRSFAQSINNPVHKVIYTFADQEDVILSLDASNTLSSSFNEHEVFNDSTVTDKIFKGSRFFLK